MKIKVSILILIGFIINVKGQSISYPSVSPLPIDESIRSGVLENGLTYYIKPISEPQAKLSMHFTVKTGSLHENKDERNFTHHIEHLAFRETAHFPQGLRGNSELLTELDMSLRDISGYGGFFKTVYYFRPLSENKKAIEKGMLWFRDIASGLDLSKKNINRERGVLLQEYTNGSNLKNKLRATHNLHNQLFPCKPDYTGVNDHIKLFPHHALKKFYEKWYRPDLMAISIVGNVDDIDELEKRVKRIFSELEPAATDMPIVECLATYLNENDTYLTEQPRFALVNSDSEFPNGNDGNQITFHLVFRDHLVTEKSNGLNDFKREQTGRFIANILNKRLKESLKEYGNTFNFYSGYKFELFPNSLHVIIGSKLKEEKEALNKALLILNQLMTHGITRTEFEGLKKEELGRLRSINTSEISYWDKQIQNHFIYNDWFPSNKISKKIEYVKNLSIGELNERLEKIIFSTPEDIGVIAPENYQSNLTNEKNIRNFIEQGFKKKTEIFVPRHSQPVLMGHEELKKLPSERALILEEDLIGIQKIQLKNGLKVILKPESTVSENPGQIHMHGFSQKGASFFPDKDYYSAMFAPFVVRHSGIGQLDKFALNEFYKINDLPPRIFPYLHLHEAGIKAQGNNENLETLLQLVYLYFTQPREDKIAFEDWKMAQEEYSSANSISDFLDALNEATGDLTTLPNASKRLPAIKTIEFDKAHKIYNQIFGNAQDFTFILAGDFIDDNVVPLLQKYLGNLPNNSFVALEPKRDSVRSFPVPGYREIPFPGLYRSVNYSYGFKFIRKNPSDDTWKEEIKVKALGMVLDRMLYSLRSNDGLSLYHTRAQGNYNRALDRFEIMLRINCTPEEFDLIKEKIFLYLNALKKSKASISDITTSLKDLEITYNDVRLEQPRQMSEKLYHYYRYGEPLFSNSVLLDFIESLTIDDISDTAKRYFKEEYLYEVLMRE